MFGILDLDRGSIYACMPICRIGNKKTIYTFCYLAKYSNPSFLPLYIARYYLQYSRKSVNTTFHANIFYFQGHSVLVAEKPVELQYIRPSVGAYAIQSNLYMMNAMSAPDLNIILRLHAFECLGTKWRGKQRGNTTKERTGWSSSNITAVAISSVLGKAHTQS